MRKALGLAARAVIALAALALAVAAAYGARWSLLGTAVAYVPATCPAGPCAALQPRSVAALVVFDLGVSVAVAGCLFGLHYAVTARGARGFALCCCAAAVCAGAGLRGLDYV